MLNRASICIQILHIVIYLPLINHYWTFTTNLYYNVFISAFVHFNLKMSFKRNVLKNLVGIMIFYQIRMIFIEYLSKLNWSIRLFILIVYYSHYIQTWLQVIWTWFRFLPFILHSLCLSSQIVSTWSINVLYNHWSNYSISCTWSNYSISCTRFI